MSLHVDAGLKSLPSLNDGLINDGLPEVNHDALSIVIDVPYALVIHLVLKIATNIAIFWI